MSTCFESNQSTSFRFRKGLLCRPIGCVPVMTMLYRWGSSLVWTLIIDAKAPTGKSPWSSHSAANCFRSIVTTGREKRNVFFTRVSRSGFSTGKAWRGSGRYVFTSTCHRWGRIRNNVREPKIFRISAPNICGREMCNRLSEVTPPTTVGMVGISFASKIGARTSSFDARHPSTTLLHVRQRLVNSFCRTW